MVLLRISQATVILMALGWAALLYTAAYLTGGHPPPAAIVGVAVIAASWILGSVGVLCGLASMWNKPRTLAKKLFVFLNAGFLAFSILVNFM
jgi:hypothetical protein